MRRFASRGNDVCQAVHQGLRKVARNADARQAAQQAAGIGLLRFFINSTESWQNGHECLFSP
jgi:hypothetical protein